MGSMERRFITADPELLKPFSPGDRKEVSNHLFRRIESADLFGLNKDVPGPAEKASQTAPHTVRGSDASVKGSRTESIISSLLSGPNNLKSLFCPSYWIYG
jgi:hypothetical protein